MFDRLKRLDERLLKLWEDDPLFFNVIVAVVVVAAFGLLMLGEELLGWR